MEFLSQSCQWLHALFLLFLNIIHFGNRNTNFKNFHFFECPSVNISIVSKLAIACLNKTIQCNHSLTAWFASIRHHTIYEPLFRGLPASGGWNHVTRLRCGLPMDPKKVAPPSRWAASALRELVALKPPSVGRRPWQKKRGVNFWKPRIKHWIWTFWRGLKLGVSFSESFASIYI